MLVLVRERRQTNGVLKITGRDVPEDEYALDFKDGAAWTLDGSDLEAASRKAAQNRVTEGLGDRSAEVAAYVMGRPDGARAAEAALALGLDKNSASTYLTRLADGGRIVRAARGPYIGRTSVTSVTNQRGDSGDS